MSDGKRIFSEQEASEILQKAAKMQEERGHGPSYTPGITLEELERIAAEAGIDPAVLQAALAPDKESKEKTKWPIELERVLQGELDPSEFDVILEAIGPAHRRQGLTQVGRTVSGTIWTGMGHSTISVNSRNGRTRLSLKANPFFSFFMVIYPLFITSILLSAALSENRAPGWVIPLIWVLALIAGTFLIPLSLKGHKKAAQKKMDDLEEKISQELADKLAAEEKMRQNLTSASPTTTESLANESEIRQQSGR